MIIINTSDGLILPGVGSFPKAMKNLQKLTQPTPSPFTPRITCRKFQNTTTCY